MADLLDNIFGTQTDEEKKKAKNPATSQSRTVTADPLENIFANSPKPTAKQVQVQSATQEQPKKEEGFFDKAVSVVGKIATSVGDFFNRQNQKNEEANYKMSVLMGNTGGGLKKETDPVTGKTKIVYPDLQKFDSATPEEKMKIANEQNQKAPIMKFLNSDTGKKVTGAISSATSNIPLKVIARVKSIGDDTYDEAYSALLAKSKDPNNNRFEKIMYGVQDSGVQSAIGALLAVGTSILTKNPKIGQAVSLAYFAPISAESQRADNKEGNVTSLGNVAIDTVGDTVISGFAESALKSVIKESTEQGVKATIKQLTKGFLVEGTTEPAQTFLKYANDYKNAGSEEEKKAVVAKVTDYVKNGGMVDEFLIGGLSGTAITGGAMATGKVMGTNGEVSPSLQSDGTTEAPKGTVTGTLDVDFSKVRDEIGTLTEAVKANPNDEQAIARLTQAQDQMNDYQTAVKERPIYITSENQDNPLATVETVQYPDGKFGVRFTADTQTSSINSTFSTSEVFNSKAEAVKAGKAEITEWAKSKIDTATPEEVEKLQEILSDIKATNKNTKVKITKEATVKEADITPRKGDKVAVVKSDIQVSPNVEKTRAGVYRVTQYSQKGDAQGKAEARFTKSKKTGKMYFEVTKDGKRVERLSLEQAKKKYGTKDRPEMVERAVNGKKEADGKWSKRQSNAPVIKNTSQNSVEKKPVKTKGEVKNSRAFKRIQERLGEYADMDVNYNKLNLAKDTANALDFIEKNPKEAKKIALGLIGAPEGVTETAISIALAEQASENKDYALQAQLERSRSLRQTRRGQEIVAERGRFNENSSHFFMQQVLQARIEQAGKQKFKFFAKNKGDKVATGAEAKMKEGSEAIKQTVKKKLTASDLAQNVIDSLTC